jgi:transcriptional regulator of heat shock response
MFYDMLTDRQQKILTLIVEEFSRNKKPIGSKEFAKKYFPNLSSATIRREFNFLTKKRFLDQPYWSAGRVPTNKLYQWFIETQEKNFDFEKDFDYWAKRLEELKNLSFAETTKEIAKLCESLAIGYLPMEEIIFKYGLKLFFEQLKEMSLVKWERIWEDLDYLDERLKKVAKDLMKEEIKIFIGEESPITRDENLSVMSYTLPIRKQKTLLVLVGPKNLICKRNFTILEAAQKILSRNN